MERMFRSKSSRLVLLVLMLVPLVVLSFKISWNYFESEREEDLSNTRPEWFLVVVITSGKSELVFLEDLEQYKQKNPNCTFLVPSGKKDLINYQLEIAQKDRRGKGTPQINVQDLGDGKQLIEVEILGDGLYRGRYEANEKEVSPLSVTSLGPMFPLLPFAVAVFAGVVEFLVIGFVIWVVKGRQKIDLA